MHFIKRALAKFDNEFDNEFRGRPDKKVMQEQIQRQAAEMLSKMRADGSGIRVLGSGYKAQSAQAMRLESLPSMVQAVGDAQVQLGMKKGKLSSLRAVHQRKYQCGDIEPQG